MSIAIYPGSFDPVTKGHEDIVERASKMFDKIIIGVLKNSNKSPTFSVEERIEMLNEVFKNCPNVEIEAFNGLLIDFAHQKNATVLLRGLRAVTDYDYELQLAQINRVLAPDVDTVYLNTNLKYSYISSSIVKEVASYHGDITPFLSPCVVERMLKKYN